MQAVVLAGGLGTRLRPLTSTIPKQLLPVAGVAMIERVLSALAAHGVDRVVMSMGHLPEPFARAYPNRRIAGVEVDFAIEPEPLDTAGAIRFAALAGGIEGTFLAVNGDVLTDLDVTALVERHRAAGAEGTIALTPVEDPSAFGVVVTDQSGRVEEFVEKPAPGTAPSNDINAGTYVLEPSFLGRVAPDQAVSIERVIFPQMAADGTLYAVVDPGYWLDAGTAAAFLRANLDAIDGTRQVEIPGSLDDSTLSLPGASIAPTATVARSVIGARAAVRDRADVEGSVLLDGAVVGEGATVHDSVLGPGSTVGAGAVLDGHCMLGEGSSVPEGARLSGARVER